MKRLIFALLLLISTSANLFAGERDWHLGLSPMLLANPDTRSLRYGTTISLEKELSGRKFMEFNIMATANEKTKDLVQDSELLAMAYYKPVLTLGKNTYSLFRLGGTLGFGSKGLLFGVGAGFEYDIILRNRMKIFISQDNILVFRGDDRFSSAISIGLKLPL